MPRPTNKKELLAESVTMGSYFVSSTSSHYEWAMKKIKAHQKNYK